MYNLFGTDGIRTRVGTDPLTPHALPRLGYAIAQWATQKYGSPLRIIMAHDGRASGTWISHGLLSGLMVKPITILQADLLPTPAIAHLVAHRPDIDLGIIISASHNQFCDNGIKIIDPATGKLSGEDETMITTLYHQNAPPAYQLLGSSHAYPTALIEYSHHVRALFPSDLLAHKKVVLDCAHGATSHIAPALFKAVGAHVITINNTPNGTNINDQCGALYLDALQKEVTTVRADIGFAFDGDGDRLMLCTKRGLIKNGDDMLAVLTQHPRYRQEQQIVGTIMSNHGFDLFLRAHGKQLVRTTVGDKYVAAYLKEHHLLVGGEQSGHIILNDYLPTADSMVTALRLIEAIRHTNNWEIETFTQYPQHLINLPVRQKKNLQDPSIAGIIAYYEQQLLTGRLVVRYSGTENLLRIMVEDSETERAKMMSHQLAQSLEKELQ